jgi:hypothetical protein
VQEAERYTLRHADRLLWSGGDVLDTYRRFYGESSLAPAERVPDAFLAELADPDAVPDSTGRPSGGLLELLYLGRLERVRARPKHEAAAAGGEPGTSRTLPL